MEAQLSHPALPMSDGESSQSSSDVATQPAGIDVSTLFAGVSLSQTEPLDAAVTRPASSLKASRDKALDLTHSSMLRHALAVSGIDISGRRRRAPL